MKESTTILRVAKPKRFVILAFEGEKMMLLNNRIIEE